MKDFLFFNMHLKIFITLKRLKFFFFFDFYSAEHWHSKGKNATVVKMQNRGWPYFHVQIAQRCTKNQSLVTGKILETEVSKNVKSLPVKYKANKKVLMTSKLFFEWLQNLNKNMNMKKEEKSPFWWITTQPKDWFQNLKTPKLFFPR